MIGALLGGVIINLLQQSLLRWRVINDFWVDALLGLLILVAVTIDAVIVSRLREIWSRTGLQVRSGGEKDQGQKEESHVA
jgi:rhamnose transport system permease protein